jgi:hypothetical protein
MFITRLQDEAVYVEDVGNGKPKLRSYTDTAFNFAFLVPDPGS